VKEQLEYEETVQLDCPSDADSEAVYSDSLSKPSRPFTHPPVTVGRLSALIPGLPPLIDFPANNTGSFIPARTLVPLHESQIGSEVALTFEDGDFSRPILLGVVQSWDAAPVRQPAPETAPSGLREDPQTLLLSAAREITLQCGKASITLTSAGKLLLRGAYLLSRSSGVNRIKGGSVQIN